MPNWVRFIANFSPLTYTAEAMRNVIQRGWGLTHFNVWFGLFTVIMWSGFFDIIALILFTITQ